MRDMASASAEPQATSGRVLVILWLARLGIQIAEAALFAYLLFYFRSLDPTFRDADVARIFAGVLIIAVPIALLSGRWMDRSTRPIAALFVCAVIAVAGLSLMAATANLQIAMTGYIIFGIGSSVFLALHSGQTLRALYHSAKPGRSLGLFNLTNTMPSLIVPWFAMLIVPAYGFGPLAWLLAAFSSVAAVLLATIMRRR
jgi:predicted MFS family arabinose efflux permease